MASVSEEKKIRNKRKFIGDSSQSLPSGLESECSSESDELHVDTVKLELGKSCLEIGNKVELKRSDDNIDWSDLTEFELEGLLLDNLDAILKNVVKKLVLYGYSEEDVTKAVLRCGFCYGGKDVVANVEDTTRGILENGSVVGPRREYEFENLEEMEKCILAKLVSVIREARPGSSTGDAMWLLLISDMDVSHACALDVDALGDGVSNGVFSKSVETQSRKEVKSVDSLLSPSNAEAEYYIISEPLSKPAVTRTKPKPAAYCSLVSQKGNKSSNPWTMSKSVSLSSQNHEDKPVGSKKINGVGKRDYVPRQKSVRVEKSYRSRGSKGASRGAKLGNFGGLIFDKKLKSVSHSTSISFKSSSLMISDINNNGTTQIRLTSPSLSNRDANTNITSLSSSTDNSTALSVAEAEFSLSLLEKFSDLSLPKVPNLSFPSMPNETSFQHRIPQGKKDETISKGPPALSVAETEFSLSVLEKFEDITLPEVPNIDFSTVPNEKSPVSVKWIPQDKKDDTIATLVPRVVELQSKLKEWNEWANQKVMQAACRLGKDKAELKTLRKEKEEVERLKKEKHTLEQNTLKKLTDIEKALLKASSQVGRADGTVCRLKKENANLRLEMEAAHLQAAQSAASCVEVSEREKHTLMQLQLGEKQKSTLQEELIAEKRKLGQLQEDLKRAKERRDELETKWKQEEKAKQELINQATKIRIERQEGDVKAKSREDLARLKADKNLQKYKEDIEKLKKEISIFRLKAGSSKIAALKRGVDGSYPSKFTDVKISTSPQTPTHYAPNLIPGNGGVKRERECVMCLSEEKSVVFLPCAHQVVCTKCNELHEKQGMKDCPSCRGPIQRRVCVRYACS
uniref:MND1-interacting protein 1-like isoform X2 n=1 Tax=Erigeron canadensis TaxID=72917 RepID=UPI001CB95FC4|nr:MND1-interacting protein 1-like isoform X2 [Erigeron canadensis]